MNRTLTICCLGLLLLIAGLPVAYLSWPAPVPASAAIDEGKVIGGPFELQDHNGRRVTDKTFHGDWTLMFFGFTHCPDICPTTLAQIGAVLDSLGTQADHLQPLFVSLDPERDTPEILAGYIHHFDERILGLTGTQAQIDAMSDAYRVYARKVPLGGSYTLDHSAVMYLIGPDGELVSHFTQPVEAYAMARTIAAALPRAAEREQ